MPRPSRLSFGNSSCRSQTEEDHWNQAPVSKLPSRWNELEEDEIKILKEAAEDIRTFMRNFRYHFPRETIPKEKVLDLAFFLTNPLKITYLSTGLNKDCGNISPAAKQILWKLLKTDFIVSPEEMAQDLKELEKHLPQIKKAEKRSFETSWRSRSESTTTNLIKSDRYSSEMKHPSVAVSFSPEKNQAKKVETPSMIQTSHQKITATLPQESPGKNSKRSKYEMAPVNRIFATKLEIMSEQNLDILF